MSAYQFTFRLEMDAKDPQREIHADSFGTTESWLIFYRKNPQGGSQLEHWRVRLDAVISMETKRG